MANEDKRYCDIHHYYYKGHICPFCLSDKTQALARKYNTGDMNESKTVTKKEKDNNDREITAEDFERLINKFNSKK